jgi:hypothetical protein
MMKGLKFPPCGTRCVLAVVVASLFATYAQAWSTIEGQVLDDESNQPVPGAIVVATWNAMELNWATDAHSVCLHVETATADAAGRYRLPDWHGWWSPNHIFLFGRSRSIVAYKFKYEPSATQRPNLETIYLKPFKGPNEVWIERRQSGFSCHAGVDQSEKNLYRVWTAIVADEAPWVTTTKQRERVFLDAANANVLLVNHAKPTTFDRSGFETNVDPNDAFKPEDLLK